MHALHSQHGMRTQKTVQQGVDGLTPYPLGLLVAPAKVTIFGCSEHCTAVERRTLQPGQRHMPLASLPTCSCSVQPVLLNLHLLI